LGHWDAMTLSTGLARWWEHSGFGQTVLVALTVAFGLQLLRMLLAELVFYLRDSLGAAAPVTGVWALGVTLRLHFSLPDLTFHFRLNFRTGTWCLSSVPRLVVLIPLSLSSRRNGRSNQSAVAGLKSNSRSLTSSDNTKCPWRSRAGPSSGRTASIWKACQA
jgi:hypothetical protein